MLIALSIIAVFILVILIVNSKIKHRLIGIVITLILLLCLQALLLADVHEHWGTTLETSKTTQSINSIAELPGNRNLLVYKNVGKGQNQNQIYIYSVLSDRHMTYSDGVQIKLHSTISTSATRTKAITRYHYTNNFSQIMFAGIANNNQVKKTVVTFNLPNNWSVVSSTNATKIGNSLKKNQVAMQSTIKDQLTTDISNQPKLAQNNKALSNEKEKLIGNYVQRIINQHHKVKIN
ncbi:DUF4811 domain-containing protein [Paucilactobacillus suebicus]|uniref:DUF4811 domain-containing protein n=1 Tax=Paucilactobacillus suebicus DSM 5007 = KCTC 3549 TaxID=1423807 RepID=A0A0R1WC82_9LACO|nr:DUF4811 domain-containing protein [Paucilactobacillus suebicus]KRM11820.1 hypothetical protein FD16_GL000490 [Paucilactobacillus suebicus DSM 5007 = KCTC 3549]